MIKILIITVHSRGGGAETVIANFVDRATGGTSGLQIDTLSKDSLDVEKPTGSRFSSYVQFFMELRSKKQKYDFLISGLEGLPFLVCMLACLGTRRPQLAMWLHCTPGPYLRFQTAKNRLIISASLLFAKNIICAAPPAAERLRAKGKNAIFLPNILNGNPSKAGGELSGVSPRLVFVGSLAPLKQPWKALEVIHELREHRGVDCTLDVFGAGPLGQLLAQQVESRQLEKWVTLHGFISDPWRFIQPGSILLLPSLTEAMPMVVIEALCRGCVVISNVYDGHAFFDGRDDLFMSRDFSNLDNVSSTICEALRWDPSEYSARLLRSMDFIKSRFDAGNSLRLLREFLEGIHPSGPANRGGA